MVHNLRHLINQHSFVEGLDNDLFDPSRIFSVRSFSLQVVRNAASSMTVHPPVKMVWKNLAPPRVELLVWFILLERLSTKDRLTRFNCSSLNDLMYVLLWLSLIYVVLWSVWRIRNKVIFEHSEPNWELEILMVKTWLGYWAKVWCHDLPFCVDQFVNNLNLIQKWHGNTNPRRLQAG